MNSSGQYGSYFEYTITIGALKNLESENLEIDKTLVLDLYIKRLPHFQCYLLKMDSHNKSELVLDVNKRVLDKRNINLRKYFGHQLSRFVRTEQLSSRPMPSF